MSRLAMQTRFLRRPALGVVFRGASALLLLAPLAIAVPAWSQGTTSIEVRAWNEGLPRGGANRAVDYPPSPVIIDFSSLEFDFILPGGAQDGQGDLDEALDWMLPTDTPIPRDPFEPDSPAVLDLLFAEPDLAFLFASPNFDIFGLAAQPDPWMLMNVAYEVPNGSSMNPTTFSHNAISDIVPLASVDRSIAFLGLVLEDADEDGSAAAQAFVTSILRGVSGVLPGGDILLTEPGSGVMVWEGGPFVPDSDPTIDAMQVVLDIIVTPGDRFAAFGGVLLIPEPTPLPLLAVGLAGLVWLRGRRGRSRVG